MDKYLGTVLDGRYEILEIIGTGGMAMVYKARDNRLNRLVAVKILKDDLALDADFRRRFQTESQAVAMLSSPNIVAVYDVSKSLDVEYIVMELIEGITLKQYMNRKGKLNWKESLHFATQITKALSHAHSRGIIHRDIKPHNIMILKDGSVKVADFGIARLQNNKSTTLTQEALGSVHYISPEQAKGAQVDARSDLYSVGVVLYEMLTSRLPFEGDSAVSVAIQHISSVPLSPRELDPEIPGGLESITMKAMNPSLSLRYQTADEMLRDFEEFRKNPGIVFPYGAAAAAVGVGAGVAGAGIPSRAADPPMTRQTAADGGRERQPDPRRRPPSQQSAKEREREAYRQKNRKARRVSSLLGVGLVVVVLLIIFVAFIWPVIDNIISPGGNEEQRIAVDSFIGRNVDDILDDEYYLEIYNFTVEHEESETTEEGFVIRQDPRPGQRVEPDRTGFIPVTLTVAIPVVQEFMPDLTGATFAEAQILLTGMGVPMNNIMRHDEPSETVMENRIIRTTPEEGEPIRPGQLVHIFVSSGLPEPDMVQVPNFEGWTFDLAVSTLNNLDLVWAQTNEHSQAAAGTVIGQSPAAGTEVEPRTRVTLTVSLGPEATPTPPVETPPVETPPVETPPIENGDGDEE